MRGKVAAIQPDGCDRDMFGRQFGREPGHDAGCAFGVIGVDQQGECGRPDAGESFECGRFIIVRLDEGMSHGAEDRDAELAMRGDGRRAGEAGQVAGARGQQTGFGTMGPAKSEVDKLLARHRQHHPSCGRGDQGLEMDKVDQPALDQLRFGQWRRDPDHGFVGKEHRALRHGVDITGKAQACQAVDKAGRIGP